jgi:hypothetical protein
MSPITQFKKWASHINATSWHYKLVSTFWEKKSRNTKACTYWWLLLPSSVLAFAITLLLLYLIFLPVGWFLGFKYKPSSEATEEGELFYPYKQDSRGKKKRFAPWQILTPLIISVVCAFIMIQYWLVVLSIAAIAIRVLLFLLMCVGFFLILAFILFLLTKGWKNPYLQSLSSQSTSKREECMEQGVSATRCLNQQAT